jgi:CRP-like cAMP-binding protein
LSSGNLILRSLPAGVMAALETHLTPVELPQSLVLQEPGHPVSQVYFPLAGMVSLLAVTPSGESIETGVVGREGVVGGLAVGGLTSFAQAIVQIRGRAQRIGAAPFRALCRDFPELRDRVDRYQAFVLTQAQQNAACHALHSLEGRLCRWLLQSEDLIESNKIALTQEFLSYMLAVRRPTVSVAAAELQRDGLIQYRRGTITILDRAGLLKRSCPCYGVLRGEIAAQRR